MITFKNLPDTTTPINAENLNSNFSGLDENQAVASIRVSTQESGNQWKKIAVMTFGGTDTYRIIGTSNVSGVNGRGHFELLISGENSNSASASLVYATNGINSSMFRVFASTNYKTITIYFESPQWTAYRINAYLTRVYDSGNDSCTLYDTKETPTGDVEIQVKQECVRKDAVSLYSGDISTTGVYTLSENTNLFKFLLIIISTDTDSQRGSVLIPSVGIYGTGSNYISVNIAGTTKWARINLDNGKNFSVSSLDSNTHIRNIYGIY